MLIPPSPSKAATQVCDNKPPLKGPLAPDAVFVGTQCVYNPPCMQSNPTRINNKRQVAMTRPGNYICLWQARESLSGLVARKRESLQQKYERQREGHVLQHNCGGGARKLY